MPDYSKRQKPKKRKRRLGRKLMIVVIGAGIALAVSEDLRNKVLDQLFGKEEEFELAHRWRDNRGRIPAAGELPRRGGGSGDAGA